VSSDLHLIQSPDDDERDERDDAVRMLLLHLTGYDHARVAWTLDRKACEQRWPGDGTALPMVLLTSLIMDAQFPRLEQVAADLRMTPQDAADALRMLVEVGESHRRAFWRPTLRRWWYRLTPWRSWWYDRADRKAEQ
jgi:hypothetical protein